MSPQHVVIAFLFFLILMGSMVQHVYVLKGLKYAKITTLCFLLVMLVGVNTEPAKDLLAFIV